MVSDTSRKIVKLESVKQLSETLLNSVSHGQKLAEPLHGHAALKKVMNTEAIAEFCI